jgi:ParB family chromosome partitioning protein
VGPIALVDINKIKTDNPYLRLESNPDLEKLKKSIETIGLINPLIVNQDFELIAGGRRFSALKEMGRTEVPITKISVNKLEEELISIDENLVRRPLNKLELEKCLGRAKDLYEKLYPEAAKVTLEELNSKDEEKRPLGGKPSFSAPTFFPS